jgi:DNA-binding NarL/FixJ family response regulator
MMDLKILIFVQIGIDFVIIAVFIFLLRRLAAINKDSSMQKGVQIFESVLTDAKKAAAQFNKQLEEKKELINKLNQKMEQKIMSINVLLNRADVLLKDNLQPGDAQKNPAASSSLEKEIIMLAEEGLDLETIADTLTISKGEVMLVLDLKKKIAQLDHK